MMKGWKWRLAVALVVVFLAGLATGLFAGAWHARFVFVGRHSGPADGRMRAHLEHELRLTPEQSAQISPIIDRTTAQLETIRKETSQRVAATFSQAHQEMIPYLTPEQQKRLEEMAQRHRHMLHSHGLPPPETP